MVRYVLPWIRKEMARTMVNELGESQVKVSGILGVTESAISQYMSSKRGSEIDITDERVLKATREAAIRVHENRGENIGKDICGICKMIRINDAVPEIYRKKIGDIDSIAECICDHFE